MRDRWYADKRDLVKWSVLIQLAKMNDAKRVLQIAYFRPDSLGFIELDGELFQIPPDVQAHFRDIRNIEKLSSPVSVSVFNEVFANRSLYMDQVQGFIKSFSNERCIVFLDPDTGLEPKNYNLNHVLEKEVTLLWSKLKPADLLVFYQHQNNRNGKEWMLPKKRQFESAIGTPAKTAHGLKLAHDVVFYYAKKV